MLFPTVNYSQIAGLVSQSSKTEIYAANMLKS